MKRSFEATGGEFGFRRGGGSRRGGVAPALIAAIAILVVGLALFMLWIRDDGSNGGESRGGELFRVVQGDFNVTVPASGELAALRQIEIRNPVEERAVITYIVPEGERVKKGDLLLKLADEQLQEEIKDDELDALSAQNEVTAAQKELEIQVSQNASDLSEAQLAVEIAELALEQWEKGEVKSKRQELQLALETAERNLQRLTEKFEESKTLVEKGFISRDEFKRDEIAMIEADAALAKANLEIEVYENYQYKIDEKQRISDLQQAQEELERVRKQNEAQLVRAQDDLKTKQGQLAIRQMRLEESKRQLAASTILAPQDGLVVYASSMESGGGFRGNDNERPQIGAELRPNELVIILPDVSQMTAAVMVHESLSGRIEPGQKATVVSDALPNRTLHGEVLSVGVLAQTGGWRDPNRRDYTVRILLEDADGLGLKPSMRAKTEIFLERVEEATYVPVQAVHRTGGQAFVYVPQGGGFAQRAVSLGRTSELYAEITNGLEPGETVLLREPKASEVVAKLPRDESSSRRTADVSTPASPATGDPAPEGQFEGDPAEGQSGRRDRGNDAPGERARGGGGSSGGLARFDANGDGVIEREELPQQMQGFFDRMDTNGDGTIDEAELEAARSAMGGGRGGPAQQPQQP